MALYITFILAGSLIFAFVYLYSIRSQRAKRAKLDLRMDKMVVDEMLKPSSPELKQQQSMGSNVGAVAIPEVSNDNRSIPKPNVINVPIFDDDEVIQSEKTVEVLAPNDTSPGREEPSLIDSGQGISSASLSNEAKPSLSAGSAMQPRPVPSEKSVNTILNQVSDVQNTSNEINVNSSEAETQTNAAGHSSQGQPLLFGENASSNNEPILLENSDIHADDKLATVGDVANQGTKPISVAQRAVAKKVSWDERDSELVAKILGENAISRDDILAIFRKYDFLLARKLHIFGFNTLTQMWSDVEREDVSAVFTDLGVSVQLADKSGALTRKELNTVSQLVLEYSDSYNRQFSFSMDLDDAIEMGRELDELGRRHSSMVVLNIVPKRKEGFRSSDIDSCTRDLNMSQSEAGVFTRYRLVNNRSNSLYYVAVADENGQFRPVKKQSPFRIHDIVVYLNVPTVEDPTDAFSNMVDEARKLATWLDGKLVDKHRRNMTTKGVNLLKGQVAEIERNMLDDGIAPGGALSHKLF